MLCVYTILKDKHDLYGFLFINFILKLFLKLFLENFYIKFQLMWEEIVRYFYTDSLMMQSAGVFVLLLLGFFIKTIIVLEKPLFLVRIIKNSIYLNNQMIQAFIISCWLNIKINKEALKDTLKVKFTYIFNQHDTKVLL